MSLIEVLVRPYAPALGTEPTLRWEYYRSSNVVQNRHNLVRSAQKLGVSHILWLDDDMTFPDDTLERLLKHRLPIVGANCTTRALPIIPVAVKNNQRIPSYGKVGIESIDQVGLAVMLTETAVFERVSLPWFLMEWDAEYPDTYCSEDMYFCRKAKREGFRIVIDHDLSKEIGHIGEMEYRQDMIDVDELSDINAGHRLRTA